MVWIVFAFLTAVAVLSALWPMMRRPRLSGGDASDKAFYNLAVEEITRDENSGLMAPQDAENARTEAARRLLAAAAAQPARTTSRLRLRVAAFGSLLAIPAIALGVYGFIGNPDYADQPLVARLNSAADPSDINAAVAKIEARLKETPDDARGWEVLAPVYMKLGRPLEAAEAWRNVIRLSGPSAERAAAFGQALTYAASGAVTPQARAAFEAAVALDPANFQSRFFLALAAEQSGDADLALEKFSALLKDGPNAPWAPAVRERIAKLGGAAEPVPENPAAAIAAMPEQERDKTIRNMVESLASRLAANGGDVEGWSRLVRAYTVLREPDKARDALASARKYLVADKAALARLDELAGELGLGG